MELTFTTIEDRAGALLDKWFGTKSAFLRVNSGHCILPREFVFYASRIRNMDIYDDDVWIVSYPRTGTILFF